MKPNFDESLHRASHNIIQECTHRQLIERQFLNDHMKSPYLHAKRDSYSSTLSMMVVLLAFIFSEANHSSKPIW